MKVQVANSKMIFTPTKNRKMVSFEPVRKKNKNES